MPLLQDTQYRLIILLCFCHDSLLLTILNYECWSFLQDVSANSRRPLYISYFIATVFHSSTCNLYGFIITAILHHYSRLRFQGNKSSHVVSKYWIPEDHDHRVIGVTLETIYTFHKVRIFAVISSWRQSAKEHLPDLCAINK